MAELDEMLGGAPGEGQVVDAQRVQARDGAADGDGRLADGVNAGHLAGRDLEVDGDQGIDPPP